MISWGDQSFMVPLSTRSTVPNQSVGQIARPYTGPLVQASAQDDLQIDSVFRKLAFYSTVALVFLHYTRLHEVINYYTNVNTRILYVFTVPAVLGFLVCGALRRSFSGRAVVYWTAFVIWMTLAIPFSTWKGGSITTVSAFIRAEYIMVLLLAGLPMTWKECRFLALTIGVAGIVNVGVAIQFTKDYGGGRVGTEFATLGNPNDYAGQLLMVLPMVIYLILYARRMKVLLRIVGTAAVLYGLYRVVAAGSRGAVLGLAIAGLFAFLATSGRRRVIVAAACAIGCCAMIPLISKSTLNRLMSYSSEYDPGSDAEQSAWIRRQLFQESITATLTHPIFGVGPGEFADFEGESKRNHEDTKVGYVNAHNSYTQIAADNGIPGFLFYVGATLSSFLMLRRIWKRAAAAGRQEIADLCYFLSIGGIGFAVAIFFLNFAYFVYLPAFAGLVISLKLAVDRELRVATPAAAPIPAPPVWMSAQVSAAATAPMPAAPQRNRYRFNRPR